MTKKPADQYVFPIIVTVLSGLNILRNLIDLSSLSVSSVLVSLIGILAVALFLTNRDHSKPLFLIWIFAQLITLGTFSFTILTNQLPEISFQIQFSGSSFFLAINFAPLLYLIGFNSLNFANVIGKIVHLRPIKPGSLLKDTKGIIVEYLELINQGKWYKVDVENAPSLYFKPKEKEDFKSKTPKVVEVKQFNEDSNALEFLSWAKLELKSN